jgi:hypothetical protein
MGTSTMSSYSWLLAWEIPHNQLAWDAPTNNYVLEFWVEFDGTYFNWCLEYII